MIPLRDEQDTTSCAVATCSIIFITSLVFVWQMIFGIDSQEIAYRFGFVPAKYTMAPIVTYSLLNKLYSPFTYMFLHGGFWHFIGNMWFLYIFGDNIEQKLGPFRFIAFYLVCGLLAAVFHFLLNHSSGVPTIGASGAIAGVMGAYFLLHPGNKILTLIPILIFPLFVRIPAFIFLGIWFFIQFINATGQGGAGGGVAWWAHIGGFLSGMALIGLNTKLPKAGFSEKVDRFTVKKRSPKLHVLTPEKDPSGGLDIYGTIVLTSLEALTGTKKLVTIPLGFKKSVYRVVVPAGIRRGAMLRLKGMGKSIPNHPPGDLLLRVDIKNAI